MFVSIVMLDCVAICSRYCMCCSYYLLFRSRVICGWSECVLWLVAMYVCICLCSFVCGVCCECVSCRLCVCLLVWCMVHSDEYGLFCFMIIAGTALFVGR